jgi:hypothetical protein
MAIGKLFKVNKLGPLGLLSAMACFVGIFLPWKITAIKSTSMIVLVPVNGTLEPMGWIMAILIVLYIMLLFANFKWNILLGFALLIMSVYEYVLIMREVAEDPLAKMSYGLYVIMISAVVMSLSKLLLFRKKEPVEGNLTSSGPQIPKL